MAFVLMMVKLFIASGAVRWSITLSLLGVSYEQVAKHVGWKSLDMAVYYNQFDTVMAIDDASSVVAHASQGSFKEG